MRWTRKRCPHCHKSLSFESGNTKKYGSPIRTCFYCNQSFVDKDYREIAIDGINWQDKLRISIFSMFYLIFGIILFSFSLFFNEMLFFIFSLIMLAIGISFTISDLLSYKKRMDELKNEEIKSENRLNNPEYAQLLKKLGYSVPKKYLPSSHQTIKNQLNVEKPKKLSVGVDIPKGLVRIISTIEDGGFIYIYPECPKSDDDFSRKYIQTEKTIHLKKGQKILLINAKIVD